jgi:iron(III) transport system ATP-binding protein
MMISLSQISKSFGDRQIIRRLDLEIPDNTSIVILGPSGSGKTTLLRLIAGLELPDHGEIHIDRQLVSRPGWAREPSQRGLGFVFQASALWPHMTVEQNIMFGIQNLPGAEARNRVIELLRQTSLTGLERRYPHQISGGEARRVALARSLAPRPHILLMDEPLTNLNPELKATLMKFIVDYSTENKTSLVYVTHDENEARPIPGRVLRLKDGSLEG